MAGWLHGFFVGDWLFVFPLCGFSLSLFCNYYYPLHMRKAPVASKAARHRREIMVRMHANVSLAKSEATLRLCTVSLSVHLRTVMMMQL